jgi:RHS repeat-associated protein
VAGTIASYAYTLDASGHRTSVTEASGRVVNYGYDNLYRLTSETIAGDAHNMNGAASYVYDAVGNRTQKTSTLPGYPGGLSNYNANDQLTTDTYDADGNTTQSLGVGYVYDFENHLLQAGSVSYVYDGDGNRVSKTVAGATTYYSIDPRSLTGYPEVISEWTAGVGYNALYVYGLELLDQWHNGYSGPVAHWYVHDGHGSVRALTDSNGAVTDTYDYDAFGNLLNSSTTQCATSSGVVTTVALGAACPAGSSPAPTYNNYLFAGEQFDPDLGMYYLRARYMNTSTGRFWTMDTYEGDRQSPLSLHKYLYASADPVNRRDPSGNDFDLTSLTVSTSIITTLAGSSSTILATVLSGLFKGLPDAIGFGFLFAPEPYGGGFGSTLSAGPIGGLEIVFLPKEKTWELYGWGSPLEGTYSLPAPLPGPAVGEKGLFGAWYWNVKGGSNFTGIAGLALAGNFYGIEQSGTSTALLFGISNDEDPALFGLATYSRVIASGTMSKGAMITAALGEESLLTIGSLANYSESGVATSGLGGLAALVINNVAVGTWIDYTWGQQ